MQLRGQAQYLPSNLNSDITQVRTLRQQVQPVVSGSDYVRLLRISAPSLYPAFKEALTHKLNII